MIAHASARQAAAVGATQAASVLCLARGFKKKGKDAPLKKQSKAEGSGRDPYVLFKEALTAMPDKDKAEMAPEGEEERAERRRRHSREAMREVRWFSRP